MRQKTYKKVEGTEDMVEITTVKKESKQQEKLEKILHNLNRDLATYQKNKVRVEENIARVTAEISELEALNN